MLSSFVLGDPAVAGAFAPLSVVLVIGAAGCVVLGGCVAAVVLIARRSHRGHGGGPQVPESGGGVDRVHNEAGHVDGPVVQVGHVGGDVITVHVPGDTPVVALEISVRLSIDLHVRPTGDGTADDGRP